MSEEEPTANSPATSAQPTTQEVPAPVPIEPTREEAEIQADREEGTAGPEHYARETQAAPETPPPEFTLPNFRAELPAGVLAEYVKTAGTLVPELRLQIGPTGWVSKCVDPSHVAMLTQELDVRGCGEWLGKEGAIAFDIEKIRECLALVKGKDTVTFGRADATHLRFGVGHFERVMHGIDPEGVTQPKVPSVNTTARVRLRTDELALMLKGAGAISDHVTLTLSPDGLRFYAEGENDRFDQVIPRDGLAELHAPEPVKSMYPLDFLDNFVRALKSPDEVVLEMGTKYPLKITYETGHSIKEYVYSINGKKHREDRWVRTGGGVFLLAPRVEED